MTYLIWLAGTIIILCALPLAAALIYRIFYNRHVNRILGDGITAPEAAPESSGKKRKWLSPFPVFWIALAVEILVIILCSAINMAKFRNSDEFTLDNAVYVLTQSDMTDDIYSDFDGSDVSGYSLTEKDNGDFTCQIYTKADDQATTPAYVVRVTYTGSETMQSWDDNLYVGEYGIGSMGDFEDTDYTIYTIIADDAVNGDGMELTINLYTEAMDDYSDSMGTYVMPEPAETFIVEIN